MSRGLKDSAKILIVETGQVFPNAQETARYLNADQSMVYNLIYELPPRAPNRTGLHFALAFREDRVTDRIPKTPTDEDKLSKFIRRHPHTRIHIEYRTLHYSRIDVADFVSMMVRMAQVLKVDLRVYREVVGLIFVWKEGDAP